MNLAYGYIAQTLQAHDERTADRINEYRRIAADRRGEEGARADGRQSALHRLGARIHARRAGGAHGLRAAH